MGLTPRLSNDLKNSLRKSFKGSINYNNNNNNNNAEKKIDISFSPITNNNNLFPSSSPLSLNNNNNNNNNNIGSSNIVIPSLSNLANIEEETEGMASPSLVLSSRNLTTQEQNMANKQ